jgi:CHRD domain-containing protein/PEP-CTERM motif-containing protein
MRPKFGFVVVLLIAAVGTLTNASAHEEIFTAALSGPAESPPNGSPGTGFATITLDLDLFTMRVQVDFSGLFGMTTAAHIHAPTLKPFAGTADVATQKPSFELFPLGVTSGTYDHIFDLALASTYNPEFIAAHGGTISGASNALIFALEDGKAYLNIHTDYYPGGEIRGFLVPEPATIGLLAVGVAGFLLLRRRRA